MATSNGANIIGFFLIPLIFKKCEYNKAVKLSFGCNIIVSFVCLISYVFSGLLIKR